jgi:hypothetical protein
VKSADTGRQATRHTSLASKTGFVSVMINDHRNGGNTTLRRERPAAQSSFLQSTNCTHKARAEAGVMPEIREPAVGCC